MSASCRFMAHDLQFLRPAGTSRGVLFLKRSYFLIYENEGRTYYSECGLLKGLSIDDRPHYEDKLLEVCTRIANGNFDIDDLRDWPSIRCGVEILKRACAQTEPGKLWHNGFYEEGKSIPINGLIWMGDETFMREQIKEKLDKGFRCIKMKVGAIDWDVEKRILQELRVAGGASLIIRVDANGAWEAGNALRRKLDFLADIEVHSIEQPIAPGQTQEMAKICEDTPVAIALDEELFNHLKLDDKEKLLCNILPQYIVLKPSLVGGFESCNEWIEVAKKNSIGYWMTSALESNIGLNAIAQYSFNHFNGEYQGLGTGSLYENNIPSPLNIVGEHIHYDRSKRWDYSILHE